MKVKQYYDATNDLYFDSTQVKNIPKTAVEISSDELKQRMEERFKNPLTPRELDFVRAIDGTFQRPSQLDRNLVRRLRDLGVLEIAYLNNSNHAKPMPIVVVTLEAKAWLSELTKHEFEQMEKAK